MRYTEEHEWLSQIGDTVLVGITKYAANELGDLVFIELPEPGLEVEAGDEVAVIESVKAASDILAPAAGTIVEVNDEIAENPALVNEDPTGAGWFFKLSLANEEDYDDFLSEEQYRQLTG